MYIRLALDGFKVIKKCYARSVYDLKIAADLRYRAKTSNSQTFAHLEAYCIIFHLMRSFRPRPDQIWLVLQLRALGCRKITKSVEIMRSTNIFTSG